MTEEKLVLEDVIADLQRIQSFKPEELRQNERLGRESDFSDVIFPAEKLVNVFKKLPAEAIDELTIEQKKLVQDWCKSVYNLFEEIKSIRTSDTDFASRREDLISQTKQAYDVNLKRLQPLIAYAVARTVDFNDLTDQARRAVQGIRDENEKILRELENVSNEAAQVLQRVKDAAAEQGVTQQAKYFQLQADDHKAASVKWLIASSLSVFLLIAYSILTLFFPYFEFFRPVSVADSIQTTASKALVFIVLAYMSAQCVKVYSAHKHNEVTNRHKQNALMTYTTLAEAGGTADTKDVVLQYAASAIYSPADSGYLKSEERASLPNPVLGLNSRSLSTNTNQSD